MNEDKLVTALHNVVDDWGIFEIVLFIIFVPFSFLYLGLRVFQEMKT